MRQKIVAANWKMNKIVQESYDFTRNLAIKLLNIRETKIILCPPFVSLFYISELLKETTIGLGGQNMHFEKSGAFTGEISGDMLKSAQCQYVILGHSERRHVFNESDEMITKKINSALEVNLKPIVCVGETLEEREAKRTEDVLQRQYNAAFSGVVESDMSEFILAYEPVWAIGTGVNATPVQASDAHKLLRGFIKSQFGEKISERIQILYGGSVKPANARSLIEKSEIDGFLIGGASLVVDSFVEISNIVEEYIKEMRR